MGSVPPGDELVTELADASDCVPEVSQQVERNTDAVIPGVV
jgi:hypothetical protein